MTSAMRLAGLFTAMLALTSVRATKTKLGSYTPVCSKSDPNLNECVKKSAEIFFPFLVKGIRDFGFPPIDPLKVPFLELSQSDGPVGLKLNISDTVHEGIRLAQFSKVSMDMKKNHWEIGMFYPRYSITGICDLGGRILLLPISGHGPCNLTSSLMDIVLSIDGKPEKNNGREYFKMSKFGVVVKFNKGSFVLEGLFGGNKELGATMNRFLNENAVEVLNEMKGTLTNVFSQIFGGLVRHVFQSVPYDELFTK